MAFRRSRFPPGLAMDIEHINAIGHALTDLSERTQALRGYL
jgi:hypothetical protein